MTIKLLGHHFIVFVEKSKGKMKQGFKARFDSPFWGVMGGALRVWEREMNHHIRYQRTVVLQVAVLIQT